jgi:histone acetyltransferase
MLQGFTKKITLPKDVYTGYIKEYDGVTLMEFVIHPLINYSRIAPTIRIQRAALAERLRSISNSHIIHPALGTAGVPFEPVDPMSIPGACFLCFSEASSTRLSFIGAPLLASLK